MTILQKTDTAQTTLYFKSPDADSTAENVLSLAFEYCAQKLRLESGQAALALLKQSQKTACQYCTYSIAQQLGLALSSLDETIKSVYIVDYDAAFDDSCFDQDAHLLPIHLLIWTGRKTRSLDALIDALDQAMTRHYADLVGISLPHLLDIQVVDDAEVENRIGWGALLTSIHQRPIQVWSR